MTPVEVVLDQEVEQVVAEARDGSFCLKPRHLDFVAALVPGILDYSRQGRRRYLAIDSGVLVKQGELVRVAVGSAAGSDDLAQLQRVVRERYLELDEHEAKAQAALAKLESSFVRGLFEYGKQGPL